MNNQFFFNQFSIEMAIIVDEAFKTFKFLIFEIQKSTAVVSSVKMDKQDFFTDYLIVKEIREKSTFQDVFTVIAESKLQIKVIIRNA